MRDLDAIVASRLRSSWGRSCNQGPKRELHKVINEKDWPGVLVVLQKDPSQAMELDRRGRTCLSTACAKQAPLTIIRALRECCQFGTDASRDKTGHTALSISILANTPLEIIEELCCRSVAIIETADHKANTPLHMACRNKYQHGVEQLVDMLVKKAPLNVMRSNCDGKTPLHIAIESRASTQVIKLLTNGELQTLQNYIIFFILFELSTNFNPPPACPKSVTIDSCGHTPLIAAIQYSAPVDAFLTLTDACPAIACFRDDSGRLPLRYAIEHRISDLPIIAALCANKECVLEKDSIGRNVLHTHMDRSAVNPGVIRILLACAPEASTEKTKFGDEPVQVAFHRYLQAHKSHSFSSQRDRDNWWTIVKLVLDASSDETNILHSALLSKKTPLEVISRIVKEERDTGPNIAGEYPLTVVAKRNHQQKDALMNLLLDQYDQPSETDLNGRSVLSIISETGGVVSSTIYRLICRYPTALRHIDLTSNMYPFMIAAAANHDLDSVFEMVLAAPDLI